MQEAVEPVLSSWESFYVIVGSSAAALTGLQFVVIALVADVKKRSTTAEIDAFATPTIVHFCAVLLLSAALSAPWPSLESPARLLGIEAIAGMVYSIIIARRASRQKGYKPVFEDWLWHAGLPFIAYATLFVTHFPLSHHLTNSLFVVAAVALLLLFVGIHNAWDAVTYIAVDRIGAEKPAAPPAVP